MKKYFDLGLFKAALIRMKNSSVALFILGLTSTVMPVISQLLFPAKNMNVYDLSVDLAHTTPSYAPVSIMVILTPLLWVAVFAPVFVSAVFSFLKNRNATDFYHSIGHSKTQIFISFFSACVAQILAFFTFFFLLSFGLWSLPVPQLNLVETEMFANYIFSLLTISLFLAAASLLAHTLTGRKLSCFILTVLIATLPLYCGFYATAVKEIVPNLPLPEGLLFFTKGDALLEHASSLPNILFLIMLAFFSVGDSNSLPDIRFSSADLTVLWIAVAVFTALAFFVYRSRKSEVAGVSFISKAVSYLARIGVTLPFMSALTVQILRLHFYAYNDQSFYMRSSLIPSLAVFAVVFCFLASLIISRKFKSAVISFCISLVQTVLLCTAISLSLVLMRAQVLNSDFSVNNVKAVWMEATDASSYEAALTKSRFSSDPELIDIVCDKVNEGSMRIKSQTYPGGTRTVNVKLKLKSGITVSRVCHVTDGNFGTLRLLLSAEPYNELLTTLPKGELDSVWLPGASSVSKEYESRYYEAFLRDYEKATVEEREKSKSCANDPSYPQISIRTNADRIAEFAILESFEESNEVLKEYVLTDETRSNDRQVFQDKLLDLFLEPSEEFKYYGNFKFYVIYNPELSLYIEKNPYADTPHSSIYKAYNLLLNDKYFTGQQAPDADSVLVCIYTGYTEKVYFYADRSTAEGICGFLKLFYK